MKVPIADLQAQYQSIKTEIDTAIQQVIASSQFILGKAVSDFQIAFAQSHEMKHCIGVGSGTDALHLCLWALGVGAGDSVITTPFTFIATTEAISLTGAQTGFVDIDPKTYTMDPQKLEEVLSKNRETVKAVIPVHLYGQAADMAGISSIARKYNVPIIEDACQAHLSKCNGKFVGHFGNAACFSFYPGKNLGAFGEAGAVLTNDDALATKIRQLRDHGQVAKYRHAFEGHNYRMDGIQGAVLGVKLKHLNKWTNRRREVASLYKKLLNGVGDLVLPTERAGAEHVYHLFVIRTKQRDALQQHLTNCQIQTSIAYPIPLHLQEAYSHLGYRAGDFPIAEQLANECLSLPVYAEMSNEQAEYVADAVKKFC